MQVRRQPWLTIVACLAAVGAARAQSAPFEISTGSTEAPAAAIPADAANSGAFRNWRLAPLGIWGSVSYNLRSTSGGDEPGTVSNLVTTTLNANTFIYQPWFATVNGSLGLTVGSSRTRSGDLELDNTSPVNRSDASKDRFLTGSARVDLFPRSRFPFEFHLERSDSRVDSGLVSTFDYTTQNIGFSQRYEPGNRAYSVVGRYDRREQTGGGIRSTQDQVGGEFNTKWKHQELSLSLALDHARRDATEESSQFRTLVARHHYRPEKALSISSTFNATQTVEQSAAFARDLSVLQWSSVGLWQREGSKLQVSGSARGLLARDAISGQDVANGGLSLGASYELNRQVRINGSVGANVSQSAGASAQVLNGNAGVSWQGDTLEFSGFRYDMFGGANGGGSVASGSGDSHTESSLGLQLGHSLSRSWLLPMQSTISLSAGQSLSTSTSSTGQGGTESHAGDGRESLAPSTSVMLLHTLGATWSVAGDNSTGYARASYSDSREVGGGQANFQMFNFQLSGNLALDRNQSLNGDLTFQRSSQAMSTLQGVPLTTAVTGLTPSEQTRSSGASGSISYIHNRLFGVPRLRFTSRLNLAQDVQRQPGALAQFSDRETRLWENRLDWQVGRLETQFEVRMSQVDGKQRRTVTWRLVRNFGR